LAPGPRSSTHRGSGASSGQLLLLLAAAAGANYRAARKEAGDMTMTSMSSTLERVQPVQRVQRANLPAALGLLASARHGLDEAATSSRPAQRYASAHLAALRAAAAVLAARARPEIPGVRRVRRSRNAWVLLTQVAPELAEWAALFAAGAGKRAAAEAGLDGAVTARESDDLVRDAEIFLALVETTMGVIHQPTLPVDTIRAS
ncbi:MAG TPA: SAV_6107 family HEPN domain-containing protein, partial [Acidothermaceae bacterium]